MEGLEQSFGAPVQRQAIAEHVAQRLLSLIQTGVLTPGQQLPAERDLSKMLGVSRPSLREALRALALLGIIDKRQGEGVFVSALDPESMLAPLHFFVSLKPHHLEALFEARILLEAGVAGLAAERLTAEDAERLRTCVELGASHMDDPAKFLEADVEFHRIIAEVSDNPFLESVAQSLQVLGKASREITAQMPEIRQQTHADHNRILEALVDHEPDRASEAMKRHLQNVRKLYHSHRQQIENDGSD